MYAHITEGEGLPGGGEQPLALQQLKRNLKSKYPKTRTRQEVCALSLQNN
jgi:hypothetical protein